MIEGFEPLDLIYIHPTTTFIYILLILLFVFLFYKLTVILQFLEDEIFDDSFDELDEIHEDQELCEVFTKLKPIICALLA